MRLPNAVHESRPWRIREIAPDFTLEDVWALPVHGGAGDFPALVEVMTSRDLAREASPVTRLLFEARWRPRPVVRLGWCRTSGRFRAGTKPRWPNGCRTICAARRRVCGSAPCVRAAVSHRHRIRRGTVEPDGARRDAPGLGRSRQGPLPGTDGGLRQATRPAREAVHGVHRAVPALGGLPGPAAPDRTGLAGRDGETQAISGINRQVARWRIEAESPWQSPASADSIISPTGRTSLRLGCH